MRGKNKDGSFKPAAQHAYHYLMRRKRKEEAARYEEKWQARNTLEGMAHQERAEFKPGDSYEPHGLSEANVVLLRDSLRGLRFVKTVVLVRKRVRYLPEYPAYLLFVKKRLFTRVSDDKAMMQIQQALNADKVTVAIYTRNHAKLWKKTGKVAGSRLF